MPNCGTCSMQTTTVSHLLNHSCVHLETGHGHMIYDKLIYIVIINLWITILWQKLLEAHAM